MRKTRVLAALLIVCLAVQWFPGFMPSAHAIMSLISEMNVWVKLNIIRAVYPTNSYFSADGQACTHDSGQRCDNCTLENINPNGTGGLPTGAEVQAADGGWSATCVAFARYVFYCLFGVSAKNYSATGRISDLPYMDVYLYAHPGDYIEYPGHAGIYTRGDETGFWMYESNFGYGHTNEVRYEDHKHVNNNVTIVYAQSYNVSRPEVKTKVHYRSGVYVIHSAWNDNICLNIEGSSTGNNANIQLYHRVNSDVQKFRLIRWDNTYYCIKSIYNGRWLDVATPIQDRSNVKLYDTNNADEDYWLLEDAGDGYVYIKNKTGYYLDVQGDQGVDNANVQLYHFVGNNSQKWRLEDVTDYAYVPDGIYTIQAAADPKYRLDIQHDSKEVRANIQLYEAINSPVQQFRFIRNGNYYTIQSVHSGYWLDIKTPITNKSNVQLWSGNNLDEEHWVLENAGDGSYYIRSNADYYLDVDKDLIANNSNIQVYRFTGSAVQKWRLGKESYTVSYDANGGSNAPAAQTKAAGSALTLTADTPTRQGYHFVHWNTQPDGNGVGYLPGSTYSNDLDLTLYAIWAVADTTPPTIVSQSVSNVTNNGYTVSVTAADDTAVASIQIEVWTDDMSQNDAVWQSAAPDANGSAVFQVLIQDFGFAQNVTYHTNIYAFDGTGNAVGPVQAEDVYVVPETTYNLAVQCVNIERTLPGIYSQIPAGTEISTSAFNFPLTAEEEEIYVFDRWSSNLGEDIFANAWEENTTFVMPAQGLDVYKYYRHREPVYANVTFYAGYGGNLHVYDAYRDAYYVVTSEEPCTLTIGENDPIGLFAEPWDFYNFDGWASDSFWVQYTTEPGEHWVTMPAYDTYLYAGFSEGPYVIDPAKAFYLPYGLTSIEEEAFANINAVYFVVPESVTSIGRHAFPADSVVYLSISIIPNLPLDAIAQSGIYIDYEYQSDLDFASSAAGTAYTVLDVHGKPIDTGN